MKSTNSEPSLIPEVRLANAKRQMIGQLAISRENNEHLMLTTAKSFLVFNKWTALRPYAGSWMKSQLPQIRETANEVLDTKKLNQIIFE